MVMMSKADIEAVIKDKEQIEQSIREHIEASVSYTHLTLPTNREV